jgi:hypothetical protein
MNAMFSFLSTGARPWSVAATGFGEMNCDTFGGIKRGRQSLRKI